MRMIKLPEPPSCTPGMPEIFEGGIYSVIRRAVVIGNGFPGAENQCLGLVRALGLSDRHSLYVSFFCLFLPVSVDSDTSCRYMSIKNFVDDCIHGCFLLIVWKI